MLSWKSIFRNFANPIILMAAGKPNLLFAIKNMGWLLLDKTIRVLGGIFVGAWVARHLGPQNYGQLNYVLTYIGLFAVFVSMGLNGPVVRGLVNIPSVKSKIIGSAFIIQVLSGLLAYILALLVAIFMKGDDNQLVLYISIYGIVLVFKSSDVVKYYFESQLMSKYVVISENIVFVTMTIAKIVLILLDTNIEWFIWLLTLEAVFYAIALFITLRIRSAGQINVRANSKTILQLIKESFPIAMSAIFVAINLNADKIILENFFSPSELGVYAAASVVVASWYFVPVALGGSVAPRLNKIYNDSIESYEKYSAKLYCYVVAGSSAIALLITLTARNLIHLLYGQQYERTAEVLMILIWSIVFISIVSIRGRLLIIEGKHKILARLTLYGAAINLALSFLLIPLYGANGAAAAFLVSWIFSALIAPLFHIQTHNHAVMALCIAKRS